MNTKQPKTLYGEYMMSHNVNPMRMGNNPEYVQTYEGAYKTGQTRPAIKLEPPRQPIKGVNNDGEGWGAKEVEEGQEIRPKINYQYTQKTKTIKDKEYDFKSSHRFISRDNSQDQQKQKGQKQKKQTNRNT